MVRKFLGHCKIIRQVGSGGMSGRVFPRFIINTRLGVASILLLLPSCVAAPHSAETYQQEALRIFPGVEVADVRAKLLEVVGNDSLQVELLGDPISSPPSPLRDDVLAAVEAAVVSRFPGTVVVPYMAAGATDGVVTRAAGMPTYGVSGLFIDPNEDFSHGLNQRGLVESFYGGLDHWYILLTTLAGPPREEDMP